MNTDEAQMDADKGREGPRISLVSVYLIWVGAIRLGGPRTLPRDRGIEFSRRRRGAKRFGECKAPEET